MYGALDSTVLNVVVDPYAIVTSAVTQLSFSSLETPQNQTRDITKILKKKLPVATGNDELVLPFDQTLFTAPLAYEAEAALPISLGQAVTKAVGVQWSFSSAKPISAGCIYVLGDTKLLQDEATTDPKASTYTINQVMPEDVVTESTYSVNVFSATGKYVASFIASADYGIFNNGIYYEVDRYGFAEDQRDIEIIRNVEGSSSIAFYHQIHKPVIRICGGAFVSNAYSGLICPISRLNVLSNETRALTLNDFLEKRLPTTIGHDSYFSGNIIGRANNGDPHNVIDNLVTLNTELISSKEVVNIVSCTAIADSWLITTDNQYNALQVIATLAYNPTSITALNKASPVFLTSTTFTSSDDWQVATGWRVSSSSVYQNKLAIRTRHQLNRLKTQRAKGAIVKNFQFNAWQVNQVEEFFMSVAHVPYKYWRITITLIKTTGVAIHTTISDISFISGCAQPVTLNTFKLILGNSYGVDVSMLDTPIDWQFNLLLIKNGRIVNSGLYNLSLTTGFKKLS
ncbi:hypothetical protein T492DRAFT_832320 [Pavlovales sp. CCMP2436]|nr:hypothetical protein T492DRAFT_832320 [Pavlovales sp. CCMP2436]